MSLRRTTLRFGPQTSEVRYRVDLYAVGPRGVPYQ